MVCLHDGEFSWWAFAAVEDMPFREEAIRFVGDGMEMTTDHTEAGELLFPRTQSTDFAKMPLETFVQFLAKADAAFYEGDIPVKEGRTGRKNMRWQADLRVPANPNTAPVELVLEAGVGPFDTAADPVTHAPGIDMACRTPGPGLLIPPLLEILVPARVDMDDRNMAKAFTHLGCLPGVIGSVHEIIEVGHTPGGGHRRQRNRDLAVMDGCVREDGTQRYTAVCRIEMQLVAPPGLQEPLRVLLRPVIAGLRQILEHLIEIHTVRLPFETARLLRLLLALAGPAAFALRRLGRRLRCRLLPALDGRRVSRHVADERVIQGRFNQGRVHPLRKTRLRELGKRP